MSVMTTSFEVPNSLLYLRDPGLVDTPEIDGEGASWHTFSCVAVSCLPDCDGPTTIAIGPSGEVSRDRLLVFDGLLPTPDGALIVETIVEEELLRIDVPKTVTRVRIWTNGHRGTDNVVIGLE